MVTEPVQSYEEFLTRGSALLQNRAPGKAYVVMYLNIVGFQAVNNFYGFNEGDRMLHAFTDFLCERQQVQVCGRIFFDNYLRLSEIDAEHNLEEGTVDYAQAIDMFLRQQQRQFHPNCKLYVAGGVCVVEGDNLIEAIDRANIAHKHAKSLGSTALIWCDERMQRSILRASSMEQSIQRALRQGEFNFYLQPKVDLRDGEIIGAEALARWVDENGDVVRPDMFIPLMERNGSVVELDLIILHNVCKMIAQRLANGLPVVPVSVNLSRVHISRSGTADRIRRIAQQHEVPAYLLQFELTETLLLHEFDGAKALVNELRGYGYKVSIDDFGSGYAGLNIWQELDFDVLKLDKVFLSENEHIRERNAALVPRIMEIAHDLHVSVVCEGVETLQQCLYLRRLGCNYVQGYFFSRPVPCEMFDRLLSYNHGHYTLPAELLAPVLPEGEVDRVKKARKNVKEKSSKVLAADKRFYTFIATICMTFLVALSAILLLYRYHVNHTMDAMLLDNVAAYGAGQREELLGQLDNYVSTLSALALTVRSSADASWASEQLGQTDVLMESYGVEYYRADQTQQAVSAEAYAQLEKGEAVIGRVMPQVGTTEQHILPVLYPILTGGRLSGCLRGQLDIAQLFTTRLYASHTTLLSTCIVNNAGEVLLSEDNALGFTNLHTLCERSGLSEEERRQLRIAVTEANAEAQAFVLARDSSTAQVLSVVGLEINGWSLVSIEEIDLVNFYYGRLTVFGTGYTLALLVCALALCGGVWAAFRRQQRKLEHQQVRYQILEQFSDTVLFEYNVHADTMHFTAGAEELVYLPKHTMPRYLHSLEQMHFHPEDERVVKTMLSGHSDETKVLNLRVLRDNGEYAWLACAFRYVYEKHQLVSVIGKLTDVDAQHRREIDLMRQTTIDTATGLLNKPTIEFAVRHAVSNEIFGYLLIVDVDDFKRVNDSYGHATGDRVLQTIGECLQSGFRESDLVGRVGGDEFLVYLRNMQDETQVLRKATLLMEKVRASQGSDHTPVTLSIGAASYPRDGNTYEDLFNAADDALYEAKRQGKNRCYLYGT